MRRDAPAEPASERRAAALFSRRALRRDEGAPRERGGKAAPLQRPGARQPAQSPPSVTFWPRPGAGVPYDRFCLVLRAGSPGSHNFSIVPPEANGVLLPTRSPRPQHARPARLGSPWRGRSVLILAGAAFSLLIPTAAVLALAA